jgi:hypothetical protein
LQDTHGCLVVNAPKVCVIDPHDDIAQLQLAVASDGATFLNLQG